MEIAIGRSVNRARGLFFPIGGLEFRNSGNRFLPWRVPKRVRGAAGCKNRQGRDFRLRPFPERPELSEIRNSAKRRPRQRRVIWWEQLTSRACVVSGPCPRRPNQPPAIFCPFRHKTQGGATFIKSTFPVPTACSTRSLISRAEVITPPRNQTLNRVHKYIFPGPEGQAHFCVTRPAWEIVARLWTVLDYLRRMPNLFSRRRSWPNRNSRMD